MYCSSVNESTLFQPGQRGAYRPLVEVCLSSKSRAGDAESRGDEESAGAGPDDEASSSDPTEAADPAAGNDDEAPDEADSTATPVADDTAENNDEPTSKPETDSSVTDYRRGGRHSVSSQSATEHRTLKRLLRRPRDLTRKPAPRHNQLRSRETHRRKRQSDHGCG